MPKLHPALAAFLVGPIAGVVHGQSWSGSLPDRVATHFRADGTPNGWMPRDDALHFYAAIVIGTNLLLLVITAFIGVIPPSLVNIPNRDHWLAPERREETTAKLAVRMGVFSLGLSAFLIAVFQLTFEAAITTPPALPAGSLPLYTVAFFVFLGGWVAWLVRTFRVAK